jgi:hypothetical protein
VEQCAIYECLAVCYDCMVFVLFAAVVDMQNQMLLT